MFVLEYKVKAKEYQLRAIDEAIRTAQFVRNKAIRYWLDNKSVGKYDLNKYCRILAKEYDFAKTLNSTARQSSAERAWSAISRFYDNCKKRTAHAEVSSACGRSKHKILGKKVPNAPAARHGSNSIRARSAGFPKFKKNTRSVEYKQSGWKLDEQTKKHISFTDKKGIGRLKLVGSRDIYFYSPEEIKRVRLLRRADGYYVQFCINIVVQEDIKPTGYAIGLDVGLKVFYADSNGCTEPNPRYYRKGEQRLNTLNRRKSRKFKRGQPQSHNYRKARNRYARLHLSISRQREELSFETSALPMYF